MMFLRCAALLLAVSLLGCGGGGSGAALPEGGQSGADKLAQQNIDQIKAKLQPIADSGVVGGSAIYGMDKSLKSAGKEALIPELDKLMKAKAPDQVKAIAKGMIEKL